MSRHHPLAATLDLYATGELSPGAAVVVGVHLARCAACFDVVAGRFEVHSARHQPVLPVAGRWLWAGWGVSLAKCEPAAGLGEYLYYTRARPGAALGNHAHEAAERIVVLEGSFQDGDEVYSVGDFSERGPIGWHSPRATKEGPCLCLVASEAKVRLKGIARLLQPFLNI